MRRHRRRAWHRVRQFFGALRPRVTPADRAEAYGYLVTPPLRALFESMMLRDQEHGLAVMRRVRAQAGEGDTALPTAALLHDCGKGRVALWQRVAYVLLGVAPGLRRRLAGGRGAMWRLLHHPALGAHLAAAAGAEADVVRMIREQEAAGADGRLAILQAADEA